MELIVVLDTNAYSDWRRTGRWHSRLALADRVVVPSIVLGELFHGFRRGNVVEENLMKLGNFLKEPQVEVMAVTLRTAELYGELLNHLQQAGTPVPTNDIWIAALSLECRGELATRDAHFRHFPMLQLSREI